MAYVVRDKRGLYLSGVILDGLGDLVVLWDDEQRRATRFAAIPYAQNMIDICAEPSPHNEPGDPGEGARIVRLRKAAPRG